MRMLGFVLVDKITLRLSNSLEETSDLTARGRFGAAVVSGVVPRFGCCLQWLGLTMCLVGAFASIGGS